MSRRKKIALWAVGALLILLLLSVLLLPTLINLEPVREKILTTISQRVEGRVEFEELDLSFFPRPRVVFHKGSLSIPGKVAGSLESVTVYPKVLPLLRGSVRISMLRIEAPEFRMELPVRPGEKEEEAKPFSPATVQETVAPVLGIMALEAPGLILVVDEGRFDLSQGDVSLLTFQDIHGRITLPPDRLEIDLACNSNLWESMSVEGWLKAEDFKGNGRIRVKDLKPHMLTDQLLPLAALRVGDSHLNLDISLETEGFKVFQGEVQGSLPLLTLQRAREKVVIRGKSLKGDFRIGEEGITVSLSQLDLDYPQLSISSTLLIDQAAPRVSLELEGRGIDINSMREAALALAGETPDVQEIFQIVKGGKVPLITFSAQGSSLADLGNLENIVIKGRIREGNIFVPEVDLELKDVTGEGVISKGILEAKNLEGRFGNTSGSEGILKLGLEGDDSPFYLNVKVQADLAQLPFVLKRVIEDKSLLKEISLVDDLRGTARGNLILSGSTAVIKPYLDVSEFSLSAEYRRVPYRIHVEGGRFAFSETTIGVENVDTTVGKSSISGLSGRIDWGKPPYFEVKFDQSTYTVDEIYPWLVSYEVLKPHLEDFRAVRGVIITHESHVKGPLLDPDRWQFNAAGEVTEPVLITTKLLGPIEITRGKFEGMEDATRQEASFQDAQVTILDASIVTSGTLKDYLAGVSRAEVNLQGDMGAESIRRLSELISMPKALTVRAPLSISKGRLVWDRGGQTSFSGDMVVQEGPRISMDISLRPGELLIKNLLIQDHGRESRFAFELNFQRKAFNLEFMGHLAEATINRLLENNPFPGGWIKGNFQAHILLEEPARSSVEGKLLAEHVVFPLAFGKPLIIDSIALEASGNKAKIESAVCTWGDRSVTLGGHLSLSPEGFSLNMDVSTGSLSWDDINDFLGRDKREKDRKEIAASWDQPVQGILRVKLEEFTYERFTWRPVHAAISFHRGGIEVAITEANVCGISTTGTVKVTPQELILDVNPFCENQEFYPMWTCLVDQEAFVTGNVDFRGKLSGRGKPEEIFQALRGDLEFLAREGRIYRGRVFSRVLGLLNTTEIFRMRLPDSGREGLAYESIRAKGTLQHGKLMVEEWVLDGPSVEIICEGEIDLIGEKIDLRVLVAPLKTVDSAVKRIPLVRGILKGTLVAIPVRVRGDLSNPTARLAPPSAVESLTGIMKKTFGLPVRVIQPDRPEGEESP